MSLGERARILVTTVGAALAAVISWVVNFGVPAHLRPQYDFIYRYLPGAKVSHERSASFGQGRGSSRVGSQMQDYSVSTGMRQQSEPRETPLRIVSLQVLKLAMVLVFCVEVLVPMYVAPSGVSMTLKDLPSTTAESIRSLKRELANIEKSNDVRPHESVATKAISPWQNLLIVADPQVTDEDSSTPNMDGLLTPLINLMSDVFMKRVTSSFPHAMKSYSVGSPEYITSQNSGVVFMGDLLDGGRFIPINADEMDSVIEDKKLHGELNENQKNLILDRAPPSEYFNSKVDTSGRWKTEISRFWNIFGTLVPKNKRKSSPPLSQLERIDDKPGSDKIGFFNTPGWYTSIVGNHDVDIGNTIDANVYSRFSSVFGKSNWAIKVSNNVTLIGVNTVAFVDFKGADGVLEKFTTLKNKRRQVMAMVDSKNKITFDKDNIEALDGMKTNGQQFNALLTSIKEEIQTLETELKAIINTLPESLAETLNFLLYPQWDVSTATILLTHIPLFRDSGEECSSISKFNIFDIPPPKSKDKLEKNEDDEAKESRDRYPFPKYIKEEYVEPKHYARDNEAVDDEVVGVHNPSDSVGKGPIDGEAKLVPSEEKDIKLDNKKKASFETDDTDEVKNIKNNILKESLRNKEAAFDISNPNAEDAEIESMFSEEVKNDGEKVDTTKLKDQSNNDSKGVDFLHVNPESDNKQKSTKEKSKKTNKSKEETTSTDTVKSKDLDISKLVKIQKEIGLKLKYRHIESGPKRDRTSRPIKLVRGKGYQNTLTDSASQLLVSLIGNAVPSHLNEEISEDYINPTRYFNKESSNDEENVRGNLLFALSGDDHDFCGYKHSTYGGLPEFTLPSYSFLQGTRHPGVARLLTGPGLNLATLVVGESYDWFWWIFNVYCIFGAFVVLHFIPEILKPFVVVEIIYTKFIDTILNFFKIPDRFPKVYSFIMLPRFVYLGILSLLSGKRLQSHSSQHKSYESIPSDNGNDKPNSASSMGAVRSTISTSNLSFQRRGPLSPTGSFVSINGDEGVVNMEGISTSHSSKPTGDYGLPLPVNTNKRSIASMTTNKILDLIKRVIVLSITIASAGIIFLSSLIILNTI